MSTLPSWEEYRSLYSISTPTEEEYLRRSYALAKAYEQVAERVIAEKYNDWLDRLAPLKDDPRATRHEFKHFSEIIKENKIADISNDEIMSLLENNE